MLQAKNSHKRVRIVVQKIVRTYPHRNVLTFIFIHHDRKANKKFYPFFCMKNKREIVFCVGKACFINQIKPSETTNGFLNCEHDIQQTAHSTATLFCLPHQSLGENKVNGHPLSRPISSPLLGAHGLTSLPADDLSTSPSEIDPGQEASERECRSAVCPLHPWPRAVAKTVGKLETDRALDLALAAAQFILK